MTILSRSFQSNVSFQKNNLRRPCLTLLGVLLLFVGGVSNALSDVVFSEDFNTEAPGDWPEDWIVENGVWEHGVPTVGPANCAGGDDVAVNDYCVGTVLDGNYPADTDSRLISPPFELPEVSSSEELQLRFAHWFSYYNDSSDSGHVQISVWDETTQTFSAFQTLSTEFAISSAVWSRINVDLTAYAGETVRLAFYHTAANRVSSVPDESHGWFVDDLEIVVEVPVFTGDFESGQSDWSVEHGIWEIGTPTTGPESCYSGQQCAGTVLNGNYPADTDSRLISPTLELPVVSGDEELQLRFQHWFSYYNDSSDSGYVQISVWDETTQTFSAFQTLGSGFAISSAVWSRINVDLTAYAGKTVRLAFYHTAANRVSGVPDESHGWFIDDLEIVVKEPVFTGDFESGQSDWSVEHGIWEIGTPTTGPESCYSGLVCAGTVLDGNYPADADSRLISPTLELPVVSGDQELQLRFQHWFSYYNDSSDSGYVQISVRDEMTGVFSAFESLGPRFVMLSSVWSRINVDLTAYAGKTVRLAFYHTAANRVSGVPDESDGWFIDDVEILVKVPMFTGDFETGQGDWSVDHGVWEIGTPTTGPGSCYSGQQCAGTVFYGNYPADTDSPLISPTLELPTVSGNEELQLRFQHWFSYYNDSSDSGYVQISVRDEMTGVFSTFESLGPRFVMLSSVWSRINVDLTAYAGQTVRLAFYHTAANRVSGAADESHGWFIDDVEILVKVPMFTGDFETGQGDWSVEHGVWEIGTPTTGPGSCYSGQQCAGTVLNGNYPADTDSQLISPPFDLPEISGDEELQLRFQHWFSYYNDSSDSGYVRISVWDETTQSFSAFESLGPRFVMMSAVWSRINVDLTAYAGKTIRLAFYHTAANRVSGVPDESAGWFIDDVEILVKVPMFTGDFETGQGDWSVEHGVWEIGTPTTGPGSCFSGQQCAGTVLSGNYPADTDSRLISPTLDLPAAELIYLRFQHWFSYYNDLYDKGYVQISVRDEITGLFSTFVLLDNLEFSGSSGGWVPVVADMTQYAGKTIRLAFYHTAANRVSGAPDESHGWFIDAIELDGYPPEPINHEPILNKIGNQSIDAGEILTFTVTATDPDGDTLSLKASNIPAGSTFTDNGDATGIFYWDTSIDDEGIYDSILFTVTDSGIPQLFDFEIITITVGDINQPPVLSEIGDQSLNAGELFILNLNATDPDEDTLTFTATDLPTGAIFTDNGDGTAQFSWTPDAGLTGNFKVTFIVTDDGSPALSDSEEVTFSVGDVNRPPILDPIGNQVIPNEEEFRLLLTATDPDGDTLAYEVSGLPTGASFTDNQDGTADFVWTPGESVTGNFRMTFKVTDSGEPPESDTESIHISVGNMNRPPVMGPVGNHGITPGEPFHFALHASDPEGDALRFIVAGLPEDAGFMDNEDGSAEFSWDPTEEDIRNYKLLFRVIDDAEPMASDWEEVTFTVGEINRPPMLAPIGDRTVETDELISLTLTCRDPDGDVPSYEATDLPEGASWTDNEDGTALFTWVPTLDQEGNHMMTFSVADDEGESDSETIVISAGGVNRPPVLNPIGDRTVDEEEPIWIPVIAGDPDGNLIDLTTLNLPEDAVFTDYGNGTGDFYWVADLEADESEGDEINLVTFVATDLGDPPSSASEEVAITVRGVCELPDELKNLKAKATRKKVTITWEYEDDFNYFIIYRKIDNEEVKEIATTTVTSYTENLPNDFDRIEYSVSAVNECGEGELAGPVVVKPKGQPR